MPTNTWQKSSYCGEGEACIHVTATTNAVWLTESSDPTRSILTVTTDTFRALLTALKANARPAVTGISVTQGDDADTTLRIHHTGTPETVVTTDRQKWEAFVLGVRAGEFDHFAGGLNAATSPQVAPQHHCPA